MPNNGHYHNNANFKEMESSGKDTWRRPLPLWAIIRSVWCFEYNLVAQRVLLINNYWPNETRGESRGKLLLQMWGCWISDPWLLSNNILVSSEDYGEPLESIMGMCGWRKSANVKHMLVWPFLVQYDIIIRQKQRLYVRFRWLECICNSKGGVLTCNWACPAAFASFCSRRVQQAHLRHLDSGSCFGYQLSGSLSQLSPPLRVPLLHKAIKTWRNPFPCAGKRGRIRRSF